MKKNEYDTTLAADFPYPGKGDWEQAAENALKGKDFDRTLKTLTYEDITIDPIYDREDIQGLAVDSLPGKLNFLRGGNTADYPGKAWEICQRMGSGIPEEFNKELNAALSSGQDTVFLSLDRASSCGASPEDSIAGDVACSGLSLSTLADLESALKDTDIRKFPVVFDTNAAGFELMILLSAYAAKAGVPLNEVNGAINFDPLGYLALEGELKASPDHYFKKMSQMIKTAVAGSLKIRMAGVSSMPYHNAGASADQELGIAVATGVEYIEAMKHRGVSAAEFSASASFRFGTGSDFFTGIAKLRAFRVLWNRILKEYGVETAGEHFHIHSETSGLNRSSLDPYVNMLRVTTETFSAIAGGADRITNDPFDSVIRSSGDFSRRVARNVQIILREESHLNRMIDPAGGSYYVEKLTADLMEKAWDFFLETEKSGGLLESIKIGFLSDRISEKRTRMENRFAVRKKVMVGVNHYGNPDEVTADAGTADPGPVHSTRIRDLKKFRKQMAAQRESMDLAGVRAVFDQGSPDVFKKGADAMLKGAGLDELFRALKGDSISLNVYGKNPVSFRLPEKIELLRKRVKKFNETSEGRHGVTVAVNEPFAKIKPRGDFSKSFFESGGMKCGIVRLEGTNPDKAAMILETGSPVAVLCAADEDYPRLVPEIAGALKKKNKRTVIVLAGDPGERKEEFRQAGADLFIYRGADLPATISGILDRLGVKNG